MEADMDKLNCKTRKINRSLTNTIIRLHEYGYTEDFSVLDMEGKSVLSHADIGEIGCNYFTVSLINQFFDTLTFRYKYLHAIETNCGMKGIVLSNTVLFSLNLPEVPLKNEYEGLTKRNQEPFALLPAM